MKWALATREQVDSAVRVLQSQDLLPSFSSTSQPNAAWARNDSAHAKAGLHQWKLRLCPPQGGTRSVKVRHHVDLSLGDTGLLSTAGLEGVSSNIGLGFASQNPST